MHKIENFEEKIMKIINDFYFETGEKIKQITLTEKVKEIFCASNTIFMPIEYKKQFKAILHSLICGKGIYADMRYAMRNPKDLINFPHNEIICFAGIPVFELEENQGATIFK